MLVNCQHGGPIDAARTLSYRSQNKLAAGRRASRIASRKKSDEWHVDNQLPNGGTEIGWFRVRTPD
jgi:hypothetical protein